MFVDSVRLHERKLEIVEGGRKNIEVENDEFLAKLNADSCLVGVDRAVC